MYTVIDERGEPRQREFIMQVCDIFEAVLFFICFNEIKKCMFYINTCQILYLQALKDLCKVFSYIEMALVLQMFFFFF